MAIRSSVIEGDDFERNEKLVEGSTILLGMSALKPKLLR